MSAAAKCACEECFYCDMPLPVRHEHDHFPVPKHAGGRKVVSACMNCHELKDRTPWTEWSPVALVVGLQELLAGEMPRSTRVPDICRQIGGVPGRWLVLPPVARLVYAKLRYLTESEAQLRPVHVDDGSVSAAQILIATGYSVAAAADAVGIPFSVIYQRLASTEGP